MAEDGTGGGALYTMREAARRKGVSYHTVSRAVRAGRLPAHRLGCQVLITAGDLGAWAPERNKAPRKYRREPDLGSIVAPVDTATLDRAGLERRVAALADMLVVGLPDAELRALAERLAALAAGLRREGG